MGRGKTIKTRRAETPPDETPAGVVQPAKTPPGAVDTSNDDEEIYSVLSAVNINTSVSSDTNSDSTGKSMTVDDNIEISPAKKRRLALLLKCSKFEVLKTAKNDPLKAFYFIARSQKIDPPVRRFIPATNTQDDRLSEVFNIILEDIEENTFNVGIWEDNGRTFYKELPRTNIDQPNYIQFPFGVSLQNAVVKAPKREFKTETTIKHLIVGMNKGSVTKVVPNFPIPEKRKIIVVEMEKEIFKNFNEIANKLKNKKLIRSKDLLIAIVTLPTKDTNNFHRCMISDGHYQAQLVSQQPLSIGSLYFLNDYQASYDFVTGSHLEGLTIHLCKDPIAADDQTLPNEDFDKHQFFRAPK